MANVSGGPTTAGGAAGTTVLVVEDEPAIAQAIVHRLSAEGWTVEAVGDGLAGVSCGVAAATRTSWCST